VTLAWFHCFSGVAGDMAFGSLVDAGADLSEVRSLLDRLPVSGWSVAAEPVLRGGIAGTKVHVRAEPSSVVRTAANIQALLADARLPPRVEGRASAVFSALADVEGRLHRRSPDQVHLHEVSGIDAIVDVVGTCAALEVLDVDEVCCSPVAVGMGMVRAVHGIIPNPAPAVVELLRGIPTRGVDLAVELTTPTGAALMAAVAGEYGPLPAMTVTASGFGAGSKELDERPNLTQVVLGEPAPAGQGGGQPSGQPVALLEANVDDVTGEVLAHTVTALLSAGAHDAWITPIVMKKGRPAHTIHVLADVALVSQLAGVLTAETGTLGVRGHQIERWPSPRHVESVLIDDQPVRVKVNPGRVKAEFDDAVRVAERTGRPVRRILAEAEASVDPARQPDPAPAIGQAIHVLEDIEAAVEPWDRASRHDDDERSAQDRPGAGHNRFDRTDDDRTDDDRTDDGTDDDRTGADRRRVVDREVGRSRVGHPSVDPPDHHIGELHAVHTDEHDPA